MSKTYGIVETFFSVQGEGVRAGTMNVFVRFAGCNLKCSDDDSNGPENNVGFSCDTDFVSRTPMTLDQVEIAVQRACDKTGAQNPNWLILTGGEPALQVDREFCDYFHEKGYKLAIETNGTKELPYEEVKFPGMAAEEAIADKVVLLPDGRIRCGAHKYLLDWITVSPKSAEHTIRQPVAHEVKYVRNVDHAIPRPSCKALHYRLSPAFDPVFVDGQARMSAGALDTCYRLCRQHPQWGLSVQMHKMIGVGVR